MKTTPTLLAAALLLLGSTLPLTAQVPQIINYQGKLTVSGAPFTGTGQFKFALVNGDGTSTFWSHDGTSTAGSEPTAALALPVVNGLYVVPLGDTSLPGMAAVPPAVFENADVRLRVWCDDGSNGSAQLSPDQRITSVGYAMMAGTVADGAVTMSKLAPQARPLHDRQQALLFTTTAVTTPAAPTFGDIPGLTLTTKDLGGPATYVVTFRTTQFYPYGAGHVQFALSLDGVTVTESQVWGTQAGGSQGWFPVSLSYMFTGVEPGSVITAQISLVGGGPPSFHLASTQMVIDGVLDSQVAP